MLEKNDYRKKLIDNYLYLSNKYYPFKNYLHKCSFSAGLE